MNMIFAGTPAFAAKILEGILSSGVDISACYSQPDKPSGRGRTIHATPVKAIANTHNIPVYQPKNFKSAVDVEKLRSLKPDLIIVVAYGLILPQAVLDIPTHGCINIHGSILPRWRGASPIQYAILNGDRETGVTIFQLDQGVDTGETLTIKSCPIAEADTTESLLNKLIPLSIEATLEVIKKINSSSLKRSKQDENLATFAPKIEKNDAILQWGKEDAKDITRKIRAYYPWPGTHLEVDATTSIKIIEAKEIFDADLANGNIAPGKIVAINKSGIIIKAKTNAVAITKLKFPGSKVLSANDVKNSSKYLAQLATLQS